MRRETKLNLAVVIGLTAISVPGAARMFYKKYNDPRPMYMNDGRRQVVPYMTPNAGVTARSGPEAVVRWAGSLAGGAYLTPPRMSRDRTFQVLSAEGGRAEVLSWDPTLTRRLVAGGATEVALPAGVVAALRDGGYVRPPATVAYVRAPVEGGEVGLAGDVARVGGTPDADTDVTAAPGA